MAFTAPEKLSIDDDKQQRMISDQQNFERIYSEIKSLELKPLMLEWKEGQVIGTRDGVEVVTIDTFKFISKRKPFKSYGGHTGDYKWDEPLYNLLNCPSKVRYISFQKNRNKVLSEYFGCPPKKMIEMLQACMFKAFIPKDLEDVAQKYCRGLGSKRRWINEYVHHLNDKKDIIRQAIRDKQDNLVPVLVAQSSAKTPKDLKRLVGKSTWKKIANNSPTRNYLIYEGIRNKTVKNVEDAVEVPSSVLKYPSRGVGGLHGGYNKLNSEVIRKARVATKPELHGKVVNTVNDTLSMYERLGREVPKQHTKWDLDKWEERHAWCVEQINLQKYSPETFPWLKGTVKEVVSTCGKYRASLLDNALSIRNEGDKMHHCVGMYFDRVARQEYLVWHIQDGEGNPSTLGCTVSKDLVKEKNKVVKFQQHYGYCNASIRDDDLKGFAEYVINTQNKIFKEEK